MYGAEEHATCSDPLGIVYVICDGIHTVFLCAFIALAALAGNQL